MISNKKKISAEIVADSINPAGDRVTTFLLTYPRFIHGELMTHRLFSRNSASSRAIPFKTMVESISVDPFIPIAWQRDHKGMQGTEYFEDFEEIYELEKEWLFAREEAVSYAISMNSRGCTKQLVNRLLEPFAWHTVLVTATEYDNFFDLRCPKLYHAASGLTFNSLRDWNSVDNEIQWNGLSCMHPENTSGAEIHIQTLAEAMWDAMNDTAPNILNNDEWHMPFMGNFNTEKLLEMSKGDVNEFEIICRKIATARAARLSYMTFDGEINYEKDIELHDMLLESKHLSPFEHCCKVPNAKELSSISGGFTHVDKDSRLWSGNIKGFIQYRHLIEKNHGIN